MGGSSKKVTVGYKYYLGMHMVLCHGPIDYVYQIKVDNREAWKGFASGGPISINKPGLFGGEQREGGVSGTVDILMGESTQTQNAYLQGRLGTNIPAFRGVVSAVLRQVYLGMNPYLKRWAFRAQRINTSTDGATQWYPSKAPIGAISDVALYIAMDISDSMATVTSSGKTRLENLKAGLEAALSPLLGIPSGSGVDIRVVGFAGGTVAIERSDVTGSDIQDIIDWINARDYSDVPNGTTQFDVAIGQAPTFFAGSGSKDRVSVFITDGESYPAGTEVPAGAIFDSISGLTGYGINIDLADTSDTAYLDNTPQDGIPVVDGGNASAIENAVVNSIFSHFDMNPAHIIRECLTDTAWGMGYLAADIDDTSFTAAADTLYDESMGISLLWDRQIPIEDFVSEIVRHINATLYVDRISGKFTLKLIRNDYDEMSLITLDESNISRVSDYSRVDPGDSINSVTVVYWDAKTGENASVTADDVALIQQYGTVINTTIQYPGFTKNSIAARAAARDLQTLSSPLLSATIEANREAAGLNIGDVFKFTWPDYHDGYIIMRVHQIALGDGKKNRVKITCTEDVFYLPTTPIVAEEDPGWVEPGGAPLPPPDQLVFESPYFELVQLLGQTTVDNQIAETPEIGYLGVAATRPDNGLNAAIWVDSGGGYEEGGALDFAPTALLGTSVDRESTSWTFTDGEDLDLVEVGQHAQIGEELFRVGAIDTGLGTITVGRAILDTLPEPHTAGDTITFWDAYSGSDNTEYVDSESLSVRVLTNSSEGQLNLANGVTSNVVMDSRAVRPYRPANLTADGLLDPDPDFYPVYPVDIAWVERNRLTETGGTFLSWTDGTITPEANTQYYIVVEALDINYVVQGTVTTATQTATTFQVTEAMIGTTWAAYPFIRVTVTTQRDGYDSWKSSYITFRGLFREPINLEAVFIPRAAPLLSGQLLP